jgi:hypothetical protein
VTNFTVRVELHGAVHDDYVNLHATMEDEGFVRWIEDSDGNKKRLPTAEYNMADVDMARSEVHKRAKRAANEVKPNPTPWIPVTESDGRTWSGPRVWRD